MTTDIEELTGEALRARVLELQAQAQAKPMTDAERQAARRILAAIVERLESEK